MENKVNENGAIRDNSTTAEGQEKTFTQTEVNAIVSERVSRERKKLNNELYATKETVSRLERENGDLKAVSELLNESGVLTGSVTEQIATLQKEYGLTRRQAKEVVDGAQQQPDETLELVKAKALTEDMTDREALEEYERIADIPEKFRTAGDRAKLKVLSKVHEKAMFARDVKEAENYVKTTYENADFAQLIASEEFLDFAKGQTLPLVEVVKKYYKVKGTPEKVRPASTGSVKSAGTAVSKDFYTREEVEKMSREEIRKNYDTIQKSVPKW